MSTPTTKSKLVLSFVQTSPAPTPISKAEKPEYPFIESINNKVSSLGKYNLISHLKVANFLANSKISTGLSSLILVFFISKSI